MTSVSGQGTPYVHLRPYEIEVDKANRKQGLGTLFMQDLSAFADFKGLQIRINPSDELGATSRGRLDKFYKRFGFLENKPGKNKDYSISERFYRPARSTSSPMKPLSNPRSSDADYLAAVKAGDMKVVQGMVDAAAKAAGYGVEGWHGSPTKGITEFYPKSHFGTKQQAEPISRDGGHLYRAYLRVQNPKRVADQHDKPQWFLASVRARKQGHDSLIYKNIWESPNPLAPQDSYLVFDANQIKSADPITRDDQGKIIPLSQRFNPNKNSIRNPMKPLMMNPKRGTYAGGTGYWRKSMGADEQKPASPKPQGESSRESMYVEYLHPLPGENRFTMGGTDFVYVWAKYPDGRRDIGVYAFSGDVTYGYGWFRTYYNLDGQRRTQDAMQPAARAKLNRMDAAIK